MEYSIKSKILFYLEFFVYRILLDIVYVYILYPVFSYSGFVCMPTIYSYVLSWGVLLILLPLIICNYDKSYISSNIITLLGCFSLVPTTSLIAFVPLDNMFISGMVIYWLILLLLNKYIPQFKINIKYSSKTSKIFVFWLLILSCTVLYISGRYTGFRFHFSLFDVYDLRFEERAFALPILLEYLHSAANILLPVMLVYFLTAKRYIIVAILSLIILLNFGIGGHKSVLFMLFLSFLGYFFFKFKRINIYCLILIGACLVSLGEFFIFKSYMFSSIMIRRALLIPSQLHIDYYNFFSKNELDYFRQGILRWFGLVSPYEDNIAFLIGGLSSGDGDYEVRANNGLFSDAYQNLGFLGMFIFPFIIIVILRLLDTVSKGLSEKLLILPILTTTMALLSTTFSTALLTSGLLLMMIILYYLPREQKYE